MARMYVTSIHQLATGFLAYNDSGGFFFAGLVIYFDVYTVGHPSVMERT